MASLFSPASLLRWMLYLQKNPYQVIVQEHFLHHTSYPHDAQRDDGLRDHSCSHLPHRHLLDKKGYLEREKTLYEVVAKGNSCLVNDKSKLFYRTMFSSIL